MLRDENALIQQCSTFVFDFGNVYFRCLSGSHIRKSATDVFFQYGLLSGFLQVSQLHKAAQGDKVSAQSA